MRRVRVEGVGVDNYLQTVVVLRDVEAPRWLPIWIGHVEATAIQARLEGKVAARPLSHDLLKNLCAALNLRVIGINIHDLQNNTFIACITLEDQARQRHEVDSRPSDAIALAIRVDCPIFVSGTALEAMRDDVQESEEDIERFKRLVEDVNLEGGA
jgi:bifunctional DNase/RNase